MKTLIVPLIGGVLALAADRVAAGPEASLFDRVGGRAVLEAIADDFVDVVMPDPKLNENPSIQEASERAPRDYVKIQLTMVLCQRSGGPCKHGGRPMHEGHASLNFREEDWERSVDLFKGVLARHQVPDAETGELLLIFSSMKSSIMGQGGRSTRER